MAIPLISKSDEIPFILSEAKRQACPLTIRLSNNPTKYFSRLVDFQTVSDDAWLLIEPLESAQANTQLMEQESFYVEFTLENTYTFASSIISKESRHGRTLLKIRHPQKRKFYRVTTETAISIDLQLASGTTYTGVIKDVSPEGIGFIMKNQTIPTEEFHTIQFVAFTLPDGTRITSRASLRYARLVHDAEEDYLLCGTSLIDLDGNLFDKMLLYVLDRKIEDEKL